MKNEKNEQEIQPKRTGLESVDLRKIIDQMKTKGEKR